MSVSATASLPRVLVTRPAAQATRVRDALRAEGLQAEALPLIDIRPMAEPGLVHAAWRGLTQRDWLFFVSPNAVEQFMAARPADVAPVWPQGVHVGAVGPGTVQALREGGVPARQVTSPGPGVAQVDSEALWERLATQPWAGRRVLIVRGDGGRAWLADQLTAAGAEIDFVQVYARGVPHLEDPGQRQLLREAQADPGRHLWLFSSAQAIDHLQQLCPDGAQAWPRGNALATHPRIAQRACAAAFGRVLSATPDLKTMVACIQSAAW